jgi:hypothetical protein
MTGTRLGLTLLAGAVALGGTASAGVLTVTYAGGVSARASLDGGASYVGAKAGASRVTGLEGFGSLPLTDFYAFSADLQRTVDGRTGAALGSMADWGLGGASDAQKQRASYLASKFSAADTAATSSAAIKGAYQLAIWELLFETGDTFALGTGTARFKTGSSATKRLAAQLIAESARHDGSFASWIVTGGGTRPRPDLIAPRVPTPTVVTVPEPMSTAGALALGLLALAGARPRRA